MKEGRSILGPGIVVTKGTAVIYGLQSFVTQQVMTVKELLKVVNSRLNIGEVAKFLYIKYGDRSCIYTQIEIKKEAIAMDKEHRYSLDPDYILKVGTQINYGHPVTYILHDDFTVTEAKKIIQDLLPAGQAVRDLYESIADSNYVYATIVKGIDAYTRLSTLSDDSNIVKGTIVRVGRDTYETPLNYRAKELKKVITDILPAGQVVRDFVPIIGTDEIEAVIVYDEPQTTEESKLPNHHILKFEAKIVDEMMVHIRAEKGNGEYLKYLSGLLRESRKTTRVMEEL